MEIVWRPIALEDLKQASHYIAEHNPRAADRFWRRILTAVERLAVLPGLGRPGRIEGTRELGRAAHPLHCRVHYDRRRGHDLVDDP